MVKSTQTRNYTIFLVFFVIAIGSIVASLSGRWNTLDGSKQVANVAGIIVGALSLTLGFANFLQASELNEIKSQEEERNYRLKEIETRLKQREFVEPGMRTLLELHKEFWDESLAEARSLLTGTAALHASKLWLRRDEAQAGYTEEHSAMLDKVDRLCALVLRALYVTTSGNIQERYETFGGLGLNWWTLVIVDGTHLAPAYVERNWKTVRNLHELLQKNRASSPYHGTAR